jgi:hypothetical protein
MRRESFGPLHEIGRIDFGKHQSQQSILGRRVAQADASGFMVAIEDYRVFRSSWNDFKNAALPALVLCKKT